MGLNKFCRCGGIISYGVKYCEKCQKVKDSETKQSYRDYQQRRSDKKEQSFYSSSEWLDCRNKIRVRDLHLCRVCLSNKKIVELDVVHHITELKEDWNSRMTKDNLIGLCNDCHRLVHRAYESDAIDKYSMQEKLSELVDSVID